MTPEELVSALAELSDLMGKTPSALSDKHLNAIDAYSRGLGKHARTILHGRHPKANSKVPIEW